MADLFLNNTIIPESTAAISPDDRGFLIGDGLFESLRTYDGRTFRLADHLRRLRASAEFLRLTMPCSDEQIEAAILELLARNECPDAYVRITITRGAGGRGLRMESSASTFVIQARALTPTPSDQYRTGIKVILSTYRQSSASPLARHQTTNYLLNILAKQQALDAGASAAVLVNEHGQVTEEATSNFFVVQNDRLLTPPVHCGLLPGVTRAVVMELAVANGIPVDEKPFNAGELFDADEAFLTSSLSGLLPVRSIDRRPLKSARGPITQRLMDAYGEATGAASE